jgi:hypothetical protein
MSAGRWSSARKSFKVPPIPSVDSPHEAAKSDGRACAHHAGGPPVPRHHLGGLGLQLAGHQILLSELPPLTLRGVTGVISAALLAALAILRRQSLKVDRALCRG